MYTFIYKKLSDAWSIINIWHSDISISDIDKIWHINFTHLTSNFQTKVSIMRHTSKNNFFIMASKRKICPRVYQLYSDQWIDRWMVGWTGERRII